MKQVERMRNVYNRFLRSLSRGISSDEKIILERVEDMENMLEDILVDMKAAEE